MNFVNLLINRICFFLAKVKNQSPFTAAVLLVSLIMNIIFNSIIGIYYIIIDKPNSFNLFYYISWLIITILMFVYSNKNKEKILNLKTQKKDNYIVILFIIIFLIFFIKIANINREKIFSLKEYDPNKPKKESLEGKIRKWWNE
jgi:hypothetical protein